jgi:CHASE1-domain containing sensor protein
LLSLSYPLTLLIAAIKRDIPGFFDVWQWFGFVRAIDKENDVLTV